MRILAVTIQNYGAFRGEHQFRYVGRGLTLVLGDNRDEPRMSSNGAAKSTLFECLDWCLFGKVPRDDHADSIINDPRYAELKDRRYASFRDGPGKDFADGRSGLEALRAHAIAAGEPAQKSGRQELLENIINDHMFGKV